ncbi:MAG: hypothetical protein H7A07_07715 [Pseudomonadales bacterium]|nr:hypothetical protein [Pseudomonadales bacterium]MCP5330831.1 hypothetical protein [Pseudomonadales bacterium]
MIPLRAIHSRWHAAALHFLCSLSVFALLLGVLLLAWYPSAYFSASGGWQGLRLVAAVDLVLGPLVTLIIFNPAKSRRELTLDVGVVVLIQLAAMLWGVRAVYEQRPVAVAFLDTSFYTVPAVSLTDQGVDLRELNRFGTSFPVFVYVEKPVAGEALQDFARRLEQERIPPHEQADLYRPLGEHLSEVFRSSLSLEQIGQVAPGMRSEIEHVLAGVNGSAEDFRYLALTSRYRNILLIFDLDGALIGTVSAPYKTAEG